MSKLSIFFLFAWAIFGGYYLGKAEAINEFNYDRDIMSFKMRQCLEQLTNKER